MCEFEVFEVCQDHSPKITTHAASKTPEEEADNDEQVLLGDITTEIEEQLVDVEVVPEHTAELRKELDNMNTGKQFLVGRSQQKRSHTSVSKRVRASMAAHEEISIDQSQLRGDRRGLENNYELEIKYHDQFIDKVPNYCRSP